MDEKKTKNDAQTPAKNSGTSAWTKAWAFDGGHPVFLRGDDLEAARAEWMRLDRRMNKVRLRLGAIAAAVSEDREYGNKNLEKFARMVDEDYKVLDNLKQVYRRIQKLEIPDRSEILSKLDKGQTNYTKLLVSSPINDPRKFVGVATRLGSDGKPVSTTEVRREAKQIKEAQRADNLLAIARANPLKPWFQAGEYRTLVVDPPTMMRMLRFGSHKHRTSHWPYAYLAEQELAVIEPLLKLPSEQSHLYLWTTHRHLEMSLRLIKAWGFRYQCVLTWAKGRGVIPWAWRYDTELALFAHRGGLPLQKMGESLVIEGGAREHSRKPKTLFTKGCTSTSRVLYSACYRIKRQASDRGIDVRANAVVVRTPTVAIKAKQLVALLRPSHPFQVVYGAVPGTAQRAPMSRTSAIYMVDSQKARMALTAASASSSIRLDHLHSECVALRFEMGKGMLPVRLIPISCSCSCRFCVRGTPPTRVRVVFLGISLEASRPLGFDGFLVSLIVSSPSGSFLFFAFCHKVLPLRENSTARDYGRNRAFSALGSDAFYDLVRRVSPEPRIDVFSREQRAGFDSWGDQEDHFSGQLRIPLLDNW